jgi:hypothetical protein
MKECPCGKVVQDLYAHRKTRGHRDRMVSAGLAQPEDIPVTIRVPTKANQGPLVYGP